MPDTLVFVIALPDGQRLYLIAVNSGGA